MKTADFLHGLALCCGIALFSQALHAQAFSRSQATASLPVRSDLVQADLRSPANKHTTSLFHRTATLDADGAYSVKITYPDGAPRMIGRYQDAALTVPDGDFTYYYSNGQVESTGVYDHGWKSGMWKCFTASGKSRADRIYYGMDWEHLQFLVGLAERAPTVGPAEESMTAL